jgi:hypothetical protein
MNEIVVTPEVPGRSRRPATVSAVLVFALVLGVVAVFAGRDGSRSPGHPALVALPAAAGSGVVGSRAPAAGPGGYQSAVVGPDSYQIQGTLPVLASHAKAYRLDGAVTKGEVGKLARALGMATAVMAEPSGWSVADGSRRLEVTKDNGGQWYYTSSAGISCAGIAAFRSGKGGIVCPAMGAGRTITAGDQAVGAAGQAVGAAGQAVGAAGQAVGAAGQATSGGAPPATVAPTAAAAVPSPVTKCLQPPCRSGAMCAAICLPEPAPVADLLSPQDALEHARDLLSRAGIDLVGADVKLSAGPTADGITVDPTVAGVPTVGMTTSLTLGAKGTIEFGQGVLAGPTPLGDYPLVGTKAGFERLQAGKWFIGGGTEQLAIALGEAPAGVTGGSRPALGGPAPAIGVPQPATRGPVKVTGVHLALVRVSGVDGQGYLEPAYIFETADTWSIPPVPAVTDGLLQIAPAPRPAPPPKLMPPRRTLVPPLGAPAAGGGAG